MAQKNMVALKSNLLSLVYSHQFQSIPIMSGKQQRLVYSIIEFLNQSIQDGTVKADDQEGLEVASAFVVSINIMFH